MAGELSGQVAIVTGGASGIGRASARLFVDEGAKVVVADIATEAGEACAAELGDNARFVRCDVTKADDIEALVAFAVATFGKLDIMFNNAGVSGDMNQRDFFDDDFSEFTDVMSVDLLGVMLGCRIAGKLMARQGSGSIINIASTAGFYGGYGILVYRAAKAGVINFTQNAAVVLGKHGIRVNVISPGAIETDMVFTGMDVSDETAKAIGKDVMAVILETQLLKRYGQVEDVANCAVFLASNRSAQITGQNIAVSGGMGVGDPVDRLEAINTVVRHAISTPDASHPTPP